MLLLPSSVRIYLATEPADMRKSIDGLMALVQQSLQRDVYSGHLFVFLSRRADRAKILCWDKGGFVLFYKRLEQGRFKRPKLSRDGSALELEAAQLAMLLDGLDLAAVRTPRRWSPPPGSTPTGGV